MTCDHCNKPIAGYIEDHICKGERMEKTTEFMKIMRDISNKYNIDETDRTILERFVKNELIVEKRQRIDKLEKEIKRLMAERNEYRELATWNQSLKRCPHCKKLMVDGYVCIHCGKDPYDS